MTKPEEEKVLRDILDLNVTIKDLELGYLIYLKDCLDLRIRNKNLMRANTTADSISPGIVRAALKADYDGGNWKEKIDESVIKSMHPEQALYLDCLVRLNEIYREIHESSLDNIII